MNLLAIIRLPLLLTMLMLNVLFAADPLYGFLKSQKGGILTSDVKWNFTKFLIGKDGEVVKR